MNKFPHTILLFFLLLYNSNFVNAQQELNLKFTPGEIIVKLKSEEKNEQQIIFSLETLAEDFKILESKPIFSKVSLNNATVKNFGLNRILKLTLSSDSDINKTLYALQKDPKIEYAQLNHIYLIDYLPHDPLVSQQWLIEKIQLEQAWDIERGSPNILLAIVDTGIDYNHEDLSDNIWLNPGEDLNGDGIADSSDFNGLDDDNNGYIDDLKGWDFTDAPHFPDGGDYLSRDNDPMDEHGHGTSVAGIVGAVAGNQVGIAGIAHNCRIMTLRAGTSQGLLEEDDVASAIVYAVDNGARVINMSFGDVAASPLLHNVMQYAFNNNCVLVASAGNSASDDIHYPSGYNETISVGATSSEDILASYSNYGATVDLTAPGVALYTTKLDNLYGEFGGTSASAPVVSAVASLLISKQPDLTNEDVKNILISSTDDLGAVGWDNFYNAGRVNAFNALQINLASEAKITFPQLDDGFNEPPVIILGTAAGTLINNYELFYGVGHNPGEWNLIEQMPQHQVINDTLGVWDFSLSTDTSYTLRLRVNNKDGSAVEAKTRIFLDRTVPEIYNIKTTGMIDGAFPCVLIEFETDDLCQSSIFYRPVNSTNTGQQIKLNYITHNHRFNFTPEFGWGEFEFQIEATNQSDLVGVVSSTDSLLIDLTGTEIQSDLFMQLEYYLPAGLLLNKIADFDGDGNNEIILNEFGLNNAYDKLKVYEYEIDEFMEVYSSDRIAIPRDWGDSDNDGLLEILASAGAASFIFESIGPGQYPSIIVWADSNDFWASRFSDLDQDGNYEIVGRTGNEFNILENNGDNNYLLVSILENPTSGENITGVPHTEIGDFDGDGLQEILIGDYDGDVYIYEAVGDNSFQNTWSQRQPLMDCIDYISSGDYDGDGIAEFAIGSHSSPELNTEHEYDARYWIFRIYESDGDNLFSPVWEQPFFGFETINNSSNGVSSGDVDDDLRDELLINIFPDFYIINFDTINNHYSPNYYFYPTQSQGNVVGDINNDGRDEFFLNNGEQIISFAKTEEITRALPAPSGFEARPLDTSHVQLTWNSMATADQYFIYKGKTTSQLLKFSQTIHTEFNDTLVTKDSTYWYAICAVSSADTGRKSSPVSVTPGEQPYITSAEFLPPNQVRLSFSEPMSASINDVTRYIFSKELNFPLSVIITKSFQQVILTLEPDTLPDGEYTVSVKNVADVDRTPIDTTQNWASFKVTQTTAAPYLIKAELTAAQEIFLYFNQQLDPVCAIKTENFIIEPNIVVEQAAINSADSCIIVLYLSNSASIGALGKDYIITVTNVKNKQGIPIEPGQGSQASLIFYKEGLSRVFTYPNPYRFNDGPGSIMFANLTKQATIKILTLTGEVIRKFKETDGNGGAEWDLKDENGKIVSSGIYLYYVQGAGQSRVGKLAIVR